MERAEQIARHAEVSEKALERYLIREIEKRGGKCLKYYNPRLAGYPDRLCLLPEGHMGWVELKSRGKRPERLQEARHEELRKLGQRVWVADCRETIDRIVKELA